jgi:phospholipid/cholesterol/gamma-HCH transport system permease protein
MWRCVRMLRARRIPARAAIALYDPVTRNADRFPELLNIFFPSADIQKWRLRYSLMIRGAMNSSVEPAKRYSIRSEPAKPGPLTVGISGMISLDTVKDFLTDVEILLDKTTDGELTFDLNGIEYLDSAGALALVLSREKAARKAIHLGITGMSSETRRMIGIVAYEETKSTGLSGKKALNVLARAENALSRLFDRMDLLCLFVGDVAVSLARTMIRPRSVRWEAVLYYMKKAGMEGLPVVGLISILMGLIMAFMASLQLRVFGANIYVASLVAIALVKELGPIMTAIIFAGRSGSAFSAEIGTMRVNEEIDALSTMGFEPVNFLVVPKVIASILVVPILTLYADLLGILGGLFVGITGMDLSVYSYMQQTMESIEVFDVVSSLFKAMCFAALIAGISCHRGFQARGGAEAVGSATTSAVVSSIFLVIITDSAFAIMLHYIR